MIAPSALQTAGIRNPASVATTVFRLCDSLPATQAPNQDSVGTNVAKALRRWLEAYESSRSLPAWVGTRPVLSLVLGGCLIVTR
jgi:hypothetical protein